MLPASAGDCFFSSKSTEGIFQSGSERATRAAGSLTGSGSTGFLMAALLKVFLAGWSIVLLTPELTLISSWPSFFFLGSSSSLADFALSRLARFLVLLKKVTGHN